MRAALLLSLHADRRSTLITLANFALRPAALVLTTWMIALVIDAAESGRTEAAYAAAAAAVVIAALNAGTAPLAVEISARMIEAASAEVDDRLMSLVGGLQGIDKLEDPELLDRMEVLQQERVYLAEGADALSLVLGVVVRGTLTVVLLAFINPILLVTPLLAIPAVIASRHAQRRRGKALDAAASDSRLADQLIRTARSTDAAEEIRVFGLADHLGELTHDLRRRADKPVVAAVARSLPLTALGAIVFAIGFVLSLVVVVHGYNAGQAGLGDIVLTLSLVTSLNVQVASAIAFSAFLQQTRSSSARLLELEEVCRADRARWNGTQKPAASLERGITLENLAFRYPGAERDALHDVNLTLSAGSVVAVVGHNGSGKSTLIKLLSGLYQPTSGRIVVDDQCLADLNIDSWRAATSACFQDFARLEFTLQHSVGLGEIARSTDEGAVRQALEHSAASTLVDSLPRGLATPLGSSTDAGTELSGGQWQRVALARARMRQAPLLLVLDEPASAIDPLAEEQLIRSYVEAARQTSSSSNGITLFASHRLSTARIADVVIVLSNGRLVEVGDHDALMARPDGHYREMFNRQARSYGLDDGGPSATPSLQGLRTLSPPEEQR
jgi:ATP-binding cassette subfamily B protein/ATP-binding cassette subfamily C protein